MTTDEDFPPKKDLTQIGITKPTESVELTGNSNFPETPEIIESFESLEQLTQNTDPDPITEPGTIEELALATEPESIQPSTTLESTQLSASTISSEQVMEQVKSYSESIGDVPATEVPAGFPFTLKLTGKLAREEQERLVDILARENMGIREMDLEPQFEAGKVLIPRISEYAGVLLIQALRGTSARIDFYVSDEPETDEHASEMHNFESAAAHSPRSPVADFLTAEKLPLTTADSLPQFPVCSVIDTVTASTTLHVNAVEVASSPQYQDAVDSLQRELKFKAHRKGALGLTNFKIELLQLSFPTRYRLVLSGSAVK